MGQPRFADIAVNLTDSQFIGTYHGRAKHSPDLDSVVQRAKEGGVERILITGTSLQESRQALDLARKYELHCTAGCHPTSTSEIDSHPSGPEGYLSELKGFIEEDRGEGGSKLIVSLGEIGLDYDRLHFAPKEVQLKHLPALIRLSRVFHLPMFLHSRTSEAHIDLVKFLRQEGWGESGDGWAGGVVHSFTGTKGEADELVQMGLYIGLNGCSLKTQENLDTVKHIPLDRILLETDAPWCSITTSHASHAHLPKDPILEKVNKPEKWKEGHGVKGRMEPVEVKVIAAVVASVKGLSYEEVANQVWENTIRLFYPEERV